jgi:hypothetical protein
VKDRKKRTAQADGMHARRRGLNEAQHEHNVDRLTAAGIPFGRGQMRPSRVVRMSERAYVRFEAQLKADADLLRMMTALGVEEEAEDV